MSLHADLLDHAEELASPGFRGRPRRVTLRRAVSATYYAVFHLLARETAALFARGPALASKVVRTVNHGEMREVSQRVAGGQRPKAFQVPGQTYPVSPDLKFVADTFILLQETRHDADYNLDRIFRRTDVVKFLTPARQAFAAWERVRNTDEARLYLAWFLAPKSWEKPPRD